MKPVYDNGWSVDLAVDIDSGDGAKQDKKYKVQWKQKPLLQARQTVDKRTLVPLSFKIYSLWEF